MALPDRYRISVAADRDLDDIWSYGAVTWNATRATQYFRDMVGIFDLLAEFPTMGRPFPSRTDGIRSYPTGAHIVLYQVRTDHIVILRVLGARQDWMGMLPDI